MIAVDLTQISARETARKASGKAIGSVIGNPDERTKPVQTRKLKTVIPRLPGIRMPGCVKKLTVEKVAKSDTTNLARGTQVFAGF